MQREIWLGEAEGLRIWIVDDRQIQIGDKLLTPEQSVRLADKLQEWRDAKSRTPKGANNQFDPDRPPSHPVNQLAAFERGVTYDPKMLVYRDDDGCPTHDKFGQPF